MPSVDRSSAGGLAVACALVSMLVVSVLLVAAPVLADEHPEPASDVEDAPELEPGTYENVSIEHPGSNLFAVELERGDVLETWLTYDSENTFQPLEVLGPDGESLDWSSSRDDPATVTADRDGTYYLNAPGPTPEVAPPETFDLHIVVENESRQSVDGSAADDDSDVSDGAEDGGGASPADSGTDRDDVVPGFGFLAALLALAACIGIRRRSRGDRNPETHRTPPPGR